jgi:large subunit ribosomal protein L32e
MESTSTKKAKAGTEERKQVKRKLSKKRRLKFRRCESWRYVRLKENWRKPKGIDSKMRLKLRSQPKLPSIGSRSPVETRYLHPSGLREVLVHKPEDLKSIDAKKQAVRIAHGVGERKRVQILKEAEEMGLRVLNPGVRLVEREESAEVSG